VLAALKAEHPRLGDEPLPEPQPTGDADPDRIPERVREQLPPPVLERVTGDATFYADYFVNVKVVDRGPFGDAARRPVIDLSRRAAQQLGFIAAGRTQVRIDGLEWGSGVSGAIS
jgi:hypothetical protein